MSDSSSLMPVTTFEALRNGEPEDATDIYFEKAEPPNSILAGASFVVHLDLQDVRVRGVENGTSYLHMLAYGIRIVGSRKLQDILQPLILQMRPTIRPLSEHRQAAPFLKFGMGVMLRHFARHPAEFDKWFGRMLAGERQNGADSVRKTIRQALGL